MHSAQRRRLIAAGLGAAALGLAGRAGAAARTVTDLAGRRVTLPARIERIASAGGSPAVNAFLFLFGQGERIVTGLPPAFRSPPWRFQETFAPGIGQRPVVSGPPPAWTPNVESLLALRPDVSFVVSRNAADLLERAGLAAIVLDWGQSDSIERTVRLLGEIFADPARADAYFAWSSEVVGEVRRRLGPTPQRPSVLYLRYATLTQPIRVPANLLIETAGGHSVTADDNPLQQDSYRFSLEQLLAWQPEVLLLAFASERERVLADPRLSELPAIRQQRIFSVPHGAHLWTHYTPEQPLGILWLAARLHPKAFRDIDALNVTRDFYQRFFGKSPAPAELAALLA